MSLGKHTKCDLSAGIANLDISELANQMEIHFYSLIRKMENKTSEILNNSLTEDDRKRTVSTMSCYGSDELIQLSEQIAKTAELLHTLQERKGREITTV
jgi:hypothetical protein